MSRSKTHWEVLHSTCKPGTVSSQQMTKEVQDMRRAYDKPAITGNGSFKVDVRGYRRVVKAHGAGIDVWGVVVRRTKVVA